MYIALACRGWRGVPWRPLRGGARSEVPLTGAAPETLDALRERRAEGLARAYRDHGDTMRRDTIRIADEAGLHSLNRIIKAWNARPNAIYKT